MKQKSEGGRRLGLLAKLVLLVPICFVLSAGWVLSTEFAAVSSRLGVSTGSYPTILRFVVGHLDEPVSAWDIRTHFIHGDLTSQEVIIHVDVDSRYVWRKPFSNQPTVECSAELRITGVSGNGTTGTRIVQSAFEREFGSDWNRMTHPALLSLLIPAIETRALNQFARRGSVAPVQITSRLSSTSPLILEWIEAGPRTNWFEVTLGWTLLLWLILAIALLFHAVLSKEIKARRWVAMKCPKCGYERQRDRAECPECGLKYERPSYVMWDPTEEPR